MELLQEILATLNDDQNLNSDNLIEKIKQEFEGKMDELYKRRDSCRYEYQLCEKEYKSWQESGLPLDHKFCDSRTLLRVAAKNGDMNIMKPLIGSGADINGNVKYTPLHEAVEDGRKEMVQFLLENGADIDAKTEVSEETPLHLAVQKGSVEITKLLIKEQAKVNEINKYGSTPLHKAVLCENVSIARLLIENEANVNFQNKDGNTSLHYAANDGNTDMVELLIESGAIINTKNGQGDTPLHRATIALQLDAIKLLVAKGAEINIKNNRGHTPLHTAAHHLSEKTILAMVELGADPWAKDNEGVTPVDQYVYGWECLQSRFDYGQIEKHPGKPGYLMKLKKAHSKNLLVRYATMLLGAIAATTLFTTGYLTPDAPRIVAAAATITATAFAIGRVIFEAFKPNIKMARVEHERLVVPQHPQ